MFEKDLRGAFIASHKKVLVVNHHLCDRSAERSILLQRLYQVKKSSPVLAGITYEKNVSSFRDQMESDRITIPEILVPLPEYGRVSNRNAHIVPYALGIVTAYCTSIAIKEGFDLIAFPDMNLMPDYHEHASYAAFSGSGKKVSVHCPFLGKTEADLAAIADVLGSIGSRPVDILAGNALDDSRPGESAK